MSLLRLLSAGKSLVGLKDGAARYQMSDPRVMPRFVSERNPFRTKTSKLANSPEANPSASVSPASLPGARPGAAAPARSVNEEVRPVAHAKRSQTKSTPRVSRWRQWLGGIGRCLGSVRGIFRRREKPADTAARSRPVRGPVQGELSLDTIRVVRNDLSDSDYEVVPRKPAVAAVEPPQAQRQASEPPRPAVSEAARGRMATRLFCAGKS